MPEETKLNFNFLTEYVLKLLEENGMGDLSEEQKNIYVPQILGHVEQRLGMELLPKLNDAQMDELARLMNKETSAQEWSDFWHSNIPTFDDDVEQVLMEFSEKVKNILGR